MRAAVLGSAAIVATGAVALALTFHVLLDPAGIEEPGCRTSLAPGRFADWLGPAHALAAAVLGGCIAWVAAARVGGRVPRGTAIWLAGVALIVAVCLALDTVGPLGFVAVFAAPPLLVIAGAAYAIGTVAIWRRDQDPGARWASLAANTEILLWILLVAGLPGSVAWAWLRGADGFCF
jgi:hypothetical protein